MRFRVKRYNYSTLYSTSLAVTLVLPLRLRASHEGSLPAA